MSGLLLSTALQACAHRPLEIEVPKATPVAVVVKATPPAELTRCADRPEGLSEDPAIIAQIPTKIRAGIIRLARAFGANASQLDRLINFNTPGSCPAKEK